MTPRRPRKPKGAKSVPDHYAKGYRMQDHALAQRTCLGPCGKPFASRGPGNRVCPTCAQANARVFLYRGE